MVISVLDLFGVSIPALSGVRIMRMAAAVSTLEP